jgi:hypothetical protein
MILCLVRAMRFGRQMYPSQAAEWIFPADSASGHLVEQKEDRSTLSKWGNDLRQSFRTVATAAGVSEFDAKLLMNHAIPGVTLVTSLGINFSKIISGPNNKRSAAPYLQHWEKPVSIFRECGIGLAAVGCGDRLWQQRVIKTTVRELLQTRK